MAEKARPKILKKKKKKSFEKKESRIKSFQMYKKVFDRNLQFQTMKHGRLPSFGKKLEYIYYTYSFRINISFTKSKLIKFKLKYLQKKKSIIKMKKLKLLKSFQSLILSEF